MRGIRRGRTFTEYNLIYRTLPEHEIVTYARGIGLTSFVYSHHGSLSDMEMRLVEFHAPAKHP